MSRVLYLLGILDAPAHAMVGNMHQFNGVLGCNYCLNPGERLVTVMVSSVFSPLSSRWLHEGPTVKL